MSVIARDTGFGLQLKMRTVIDGKRMVKGLITKFGYKRYIVIAYNSIKPVKSSSTTGLAFNSHPGKR